jgi:hypothetical protein
MNAERWWVGKDQPTSSPPPHSSGLPIVAQERRDRSCDRVSVKAGRAHRKPSAAAAGTRGPEAANPSSGPDAGVPKSREGAGRRWRRCGAAEEHPADLQAQNPYRVQGARYIGPKTPKVTSLHCF